MQNLLKTNAADAAGYFLSIALRFKAESVKIWTTFCFFLFALFLVVYSNLLFSVTNTEVKDAHKM